MKAVVQREYGSPDGLAVSHRVRPVPDSNEVLVDVHTASVHPDVWHTVRGIPYVLRLMGAGVRRPTNPVPGTDLAGRVEAVGADVSAFDPGDAVFGEVVGGFTWANGGTYAEYATAPAHGLARVPESISLETAGAVPNAGVIAYHYVHHLGEVHSDHHVLVNGAGGGVGTIAVQLAAATGADVTGVDSADKLDVVSELGADHVIDYAETDVTRGTEQYDRIVDVAGSHTYAEYKRVLAPSGQYFLIGHDHFGAAGRRVLGSLPRALGLLLRSTVDEHLAGMGFSTPEKGEAMAFLADSLESGTLRPVVDRTYPLVEVTAAIRRLETGAVTGRPLISV